MKIKLIILLIISTFYLNAGNTINNAAPIIRNLNKLEEIVRFCSRKKIDTLHLSENEHYMTFLGVTEDRELVLSQYPKIKNNLLPDLQKWTKKPYISAVFYKIELNSSKRVLLDWSKEQLDKFQTIIHHKTDNTNFINVYEVFMGTVLTLTDDIKKISIVIPGDKKLTPPMDPLVIKADIP